MRYHLTVLLLFIISSGALCRDITSLSNHISTYQQINQKVKYKFGAFEIDKYLYVHNIRANVANYLEYKRQKDGWSNYYIEEFRNAYRIYIEALDDPNNPYRFQTDEFGRLSDSKGKLDNVDNDDYWYDNKGNRITGSEYQSLKESKKKKYKAFQANLEVALYFFEIGNRVVKRMNQK